METLEKDFDLTEIINGEEIMGPSPFGKHQLIAANLYGVLYQHVKQNEAGRVFFSPLDVIFEEGINRLQPDILFIKKENMAIFQDWVRGVPDLIIEIVSTGTYNRDTSIKKKIYEKYRVPEYWIVIPQLQIIEVFTIVNGRYEQFCIAELEGSVTSKVIEGLTVNVRDIFE
ncbi:MAG: Uma2 family endonuclease [Nitrospirae bacterium]|nr:Uma2 family endonuclease [Nitrospirota bacterium]MBF0535318.1 Uma2 family endonuclease [Nitrospirota bacterium]MBF0617259.1 Uma2 family endonuclease [Nitrospirota bacterium]